jgi:hypothetical protein
MLKRGRLLSLILIPPLWAAGAVLLWSYRKEEARWRDLTARVPADITIERVGETGMRGWWADVIDNDCQIGRVDLQNHDVWYYAFASHHLVEGSDSYTVFRGKTGMIRLKGQAFCCEVDFGHRKRPADSDAFIALLRQSGDEVDIMK